MTRILVSCIAALALTACTTAQARYPEPIPGSITYGGQPRTKLTRAPVGSTFPHRFINEQGNQVIETYRVQPDRSLLLVDQVVIVEFLR